MFFTKLLSNRGVSQQGHLFMSGMRKAGVGKLRGISNPGVLQRAAVDVKTAGETASHVANQAKFHAINTYLNASKSPVTHASKTLAGELLEQYTGITFK